MSAVSVFVSFFTGTGEDEALFDLLFAAGEEDADELEEATEGEAIAGEVEEDEEEAEDEVVEEVVVVEGVEGEEEEEEKTGQGVRKDRLGAAWTMYC